jgi:oligopeptide transport system substrate-binding protein
VRGRGETGRRSRLKIGFPWSAGSSPAVRTIVVVGAALLAASCNRRADTGAVVVSAIGSPPTLANPDLRPIDEPSRALIDATAQGLVRFDATGQIEPGLAERWTVIDDGMTYIFRLRRATWADGRPVTAEEVAARLKRHVAPTSRNPLAPFLSAIDDVVVMTPEVIEVRLTRPRPDLLNLFAQPEMALLRTRPVSGSGPFRLVQPGLSPLLRPAVDPDRDEDDEAGRGARPEHDVRLIGERAALAVTRFAAKRSDMVTGGRFSDWPLLSAAGVAPANVKVDPAAGLFGLAFTSRDGLLADAGTRDAISASIDRTAVLETVRNQWLPTETLLPDQLDSATPPSIPAWVALPLAQRRQAAAALVRAWGKPVRLRIALPAGPGATLLFAQLATNLAAIGIAADRVAADAPAELRLIDEVAPYDSGRWYLQTACAPCGPEASAALESARLAPTLLERSRQVAIADAALTRDAAFIPLGRPLRWSLVALRLRLWTANARAAHPLNRLRIDTR